MVNIEGVIGSDNNDVIVGDSNDNKLYGGTGDDLIDGSLGKDEISTGDGNDAVVIRKGDGGDTIIEADTISDFTDGSDLIALHNIDYSDLTIDQSLGDYVSDAIIRADRIPRCY